MRRCLRNSIATRRLLSLLLGLDDGDFDGAYVREECPETGGACFALGRHFAGAAPEPDGGQVTVELKDRYWVDSKRHCIVAEEHSWFAEHEILRTRVDYDVQWNEPIPEDTWQCTASPHAFRKHLAAGHVARDVECARTHAGDLGWTTEEAELTLAMQYVRTIVPGVYAKPLVAGTHGGIALSLAGERFWWHDGVLHVVDASTNPWVPEAPPDVSTAMQGLGYTQDDDELRLDLSDARDVAAAVAGGVHIGSRWSEAYDAYRNCRTYHHTAAIEYVEEANNATSRHERATQTLSLGRPDRLALDWTVDRGDGAVERGWIRAGGGQVEYFSSVEGSLRQFTLRGALFRAHRRARLPERVVGMLLNDAALLEPGTLPYARETGQADRYRLVFPTCDHNDTALEQRLPLMAYSLDAASHGIVEYTCRYGTPEFGLKHTVRYEPQFNTFIPPEVWTVPEEAG